MSTIVQRRRGTTAQHAAFTGALGETTFDTDLNRPVVHDGILPGGFPSAMLHLSQLFPLSQTLAADENFFGNTTDPDNAIVFLNPVGVGTNTLDFRTNGTLDANFIRKYNTTPFQIELASSGNLDLVVDSRNVATGTSVRFLTNGIRDSGLQTLLAEFFDSGRTDLTGQLRLPNTTSALGAGGGIYFGGNLGIHNFGGANNFFVGIFSGNLTMTGNFNSAFGSQTLISNTIGASNSVFGFRAMQNNTTGDENTVMGVDALFTNIAGVDNTAIGVGALYFNTSSNNIALGYHAGVNITTGTKNIVIGYNIDSPTPTNSNTLTIGNLIFGTGVDGVDLGISTGSVGIGVINPITKLDIAGGVNILSTSRLSFGGLTSAFPAIGRNGINLEILGADGAGPSGLYIYNTKTSATDFERLNIVWDTGAAQIFTEKGSVGGVATPLQFGTDGTARLSISDTGVIGWGPSLTTSVLNTDGSIFIDDGASNLFRADITAGTVSIGTIVDFDVGLSTIGFFGTSAIQQDVVQLTNNAVGGNADTVDTFIGALYTTDAPVIEGNFNQLALKVNQIIALLEAYGLSTP